MIVSKNRGKLLISSALKFVRNHSQFRIIFSLQSNLFFYQNLRSQTSVQNVNVLFFKKTALQNRCREITMVSCLRFEVFFISIAVSQRKLTVNAATSLFFGDLSFAKSQFLYYTVAKQSNFSNLHFPLLFFFNFGTNQVFWLSTFPTYQLKYKKIRSQMKTRSKFNCFLLQHNLVFFLATYFCHILIKKYY